MPTEGIVATLQASLPDLLAVYLFGSHAQGRARSDSDIDLAVLVAGKLDPVSTWQLAEMLAARFDRDVDLVDLRTASTVMQYQIITTGQLLWKKDGQAPLYECFILSQKTDLDEARRDLIADIHRAGSVYGHKA